MRAGTTDRCAHVGCPIVLRWNGGAWVHAIRNRAYDHAPVPTNYEVPAPAMPAAEALAAIGLAARRPARRLFSLVTITDDGDSYVAHHWLTDAVSAWAHANRVATLGAAWQLVGPTGRTLFDSRWGRGHAALAI